MSIWYRVFGRAETPVPKGLLTDSLHRFGEKVTVEFEGEDWGQFTVTYGKGSPLVMERFHVTEEGIRAELNTWAGFLETCDYSPSYISLMEHMIQTVQLFTLRRPIDVSDEVLVEDLCEILCQVIAQATDGVYQIDHVGFHTAEGTLLLKEY
jgi:hypothetical protein